MLAGSALKTSAQVAAWIVFVGVGVGAFGGTGPWGLASVAIALAAPVAILAFVGTVTSIWRGPPVVAFAPEKGQCCGEEESEPVRAYAQLRGMIGGAGHVHPARLVFPAVAWGAALVAGALGATQPDPELVGIWPAGIAVAGALGTWLFPARPYWYREMTGGGAVVSPPDAVAALVARELGEGAPGIAAVHETGRAAPILRNGGAGPGGARHGPVVASARDELPTFGRRPPRYAVHRSLVVQQGGKEFEVATVNVSDGGLAVRWPAELPVIAGDVVVKLRDGGSVCGLDAVVRWNAAAERDRTVGLKVIAEGREARAWREFVEAVARSSALTA